MPLTPVHRPGGVTASFKDRSGTLAAGATAQQLAPESANRRYLLVQNLSTGDLWINFGVDAVQNQPSIKILPDGVFAMEGAFVSGDAVSIIGATLGQAFTAKEG